MAAKVVCMASAKGGSGKTVLTATFGAFLVAIGKRVLLIDTDAATNGLTLMYLKEARMQSELALSKQRRPRGIYEGISKEQDAELITLKSGVKVIPATYSFINVENVALESFRDSLQYTIHSYREEFDYIFLDAQAGADSFAQTAMKRDVSNEVIIVSEYDPLSAAGVERLKGLLREDLTYERTWVLLNKMLPDFVQSFSDFMEVAKYASPIPWDAEVVKAYARRRLALDLERGNAYTIAVMQTLRSIFAEEIDTEMAKWLENKASALREPLDIQYKDATRELEGLIRQRHVAKSKALRERFVQFNIGGVTVVTLIGVYVYFGPKLGSTTFWAVLPALMGAMALIILLAIRFFGVLPSIGLDIEDTHMRIQQEAIEQRIKKLEMLRQADPESLLLLRQGSKDLT